MKENNIISLADINPEEMYNVFTDLDKYNHAMKVKAKTLNTTVEELIYKEDNQYNLINKGE